MHFGFALDLSDIDLWNIDLLDTHLDLLDTDIPSKYFVCFQDVLKTSSRYVFKRSSRHVFKTSSRHLEDVFSITIFLLPRHLEGIFKRSSRRLQNVLKTNKCLLGIYLSICLSVCLSVCMYVCLSGFLSIYLSKGRLRGKTLRS